jgi:hypothetical protein
MKTIKNYAVQNMQTGLIEQKFNNLFETVKLCDKLNNLNSIQPEFKTVYIVNGIIYDSEYDYINS